MSRRPLVRLAVCLGLLSTAASAQDTVALDACITAHESGQEERLNGRLLAARASFRRCSASGCPAPIVAQCTEWSMELRTEIPSVVITVRENGRDRTDARVTLDGKPLQRSWVGAVLELDPGKHSLRVEVDGAAPIEHSFVAAPGETQRLVSLDVPVRAPERPAPAEPPASPPYLGYALAGVGASALGASAALWLSAKSDLDDYEGTCSPRCNPDDVEGSKRKALFSDVALALGVVSLAGGSYLVLSHGPVAEENRGLWLSASGRF